MAEQLHWYAAAKGEGLVDDAPRKRDLIALLDAKHDQPGLTRRIRSGYYEMVIPDTGVVYFIANEVVARELQWVG